jgi:hypothetical protein
MDVENMNCICKISMKHLKGIDYSAILGFDGFQPFTSELFSCLSSKNIKIKIQKIIIFLFCMDVKFGLSS